ncbi:MAG: hypothetical protein OXC05_06890 [Halieaceae bacterium]|nr:hypothetical protein [Halieaceae bacterium]
MLSHKTQVICVWSIPTFLVGYITAFVFISGFVPPPAPSLSADEIANLFNDNATRIRIGQLLCMVFAILYMPWAGVVTVQMARIEGRLPVLAWLQLAGATMLTLLFMICSLLWLTTAFRPLQDPLNTQLLNDLSWLIFVMAYPEYWLQLIAMATVFLRDKSEQPFLPRWSCYFTFMVAVTGMGGSFAAFFKLGPWAWNGIFGFWVPIVSYLIWLIVMFVLLLKGLKRQSLDAEAA